MARLGAKERASLPNSAFADVDASGRRRLPIHDAAHVRNALARFNQVEFLSEMARDRARTRLLRAAKRFKVVPIGFIAGQLASERSAARHGPTNLPTGFVTLLMIDLEGSTAIVQDIGTDFSRLIDEYWSALRACISASGGHEVEARADEFFAAFASPRDAVDAAVAIQRAFPVREWPGRVDLRVRIGIHSGYPTSTPSNYVGLDVNTASRICALGHGGQIVVSANTREAVKASAPIGVRFTALGSYQLRGVTGPVDLFQVGAPGLRSRFPPLRAG
jgi:class 3 adenylate cyclase